MRASTRPASDGVQWVKRGFVIFRKQPLALVTLLFAYWLAMLLLTQIPFGIGNILPLVLVPGLSVGFMLAAKQADAGQAPFPPVLVSPFQDAGVAKSLLILGVIYAVGLLLVLLTSSIADGGQLLKLILLGSGVDEDAMNDRAVLTAAMIALAAYLPFQAAFWFSPVLVAWHQVSIGQALFYSLVACWINKAAFGVYSIAWLVIALVISSTAGIFVKGLGLGGNAVVLFVMPLMVILISTLYASFFVTYEAIFEAPEAKI